jgi:membrane protein required for colicin V production
MNYFDIIILIPLLWGAWRGFQRGLIFEIAMIIGLLLGLYLAFKFSMLFEGLVSKHISSNGVHYISFFLVFILVILIMVLLAKFLESILKAVKLNAFNKIAGAVFGILKYLLITSIILTLFRPVDEQLKLLKPEWKEESLFYAPVVKASQYIFPALNDVKEVFEKKL